MSDLSLKISEWLQTQLQNTDIYLVDIQYFAKREKIQVFLEADSHLKIESCVAISRYLENLLESNEFVSENYTLEVSSPGVGTPFKVARQYQKALGKALEITLNDKQIIQGILTHIDPNNLSISPLPDKSSRPKKQDKPDIQTIALNTIKQSKEIIVF